MKCNKCMKKFTCPDADEYKNGNDCAGYGYSETKIKEEKEDIQKTKKEIIAQLTKNVKQKEDNSYFRKMAEEQLE